MALHLLPLNRRILSEGSCFLTVESCRIYRSVVSHFEIIFAVLHMFSFFRVTVFIHVCSSDISYCILITYILLIW